MQLIWYVFVFFTLRDFNWNPKQKKSTVIAANFIYEYENTIKHKILTFAMYHTFQKLVVSFKGAHLPPGGKSFITCDYLLRFE